MTDPTVDLLRVLRIQSLRDYAASEQEQARQHALEARSALQRALEIEREVVDHG